MHTSTSERKFIGEVNLAESKHAKLCSPSNTGIEPRLVVHGPFHWFVPLRISLPRPRFFPLGRHMSIFSGKQHFGNYINDGWMADRLLDLSRMPASDMPYASLFPDATWARAFDNCRLLGTKLTNRIGLP
ncbi:hypothetical protein BaRGS_00026499 [Batillaria attramentaria]|uniref:Uncharacterized protein n=1 Tax=Batillaria attramentaria TaxID=370345 RepID=A0ABD0K4J9_9CAEN